MVGFRAQDEFLFFVNQPVNISIYTNALKTSTCILASAQQDFGIFIGIKMKYMPLVNWCWLFLLVEFIRLRSIFAGMPPSDAVRTAMEKAKKLQADAKSRRVLGSCVHPNRQVISVLNKAYT